jgi:imidazolonepropionase-like amidohydrolase
MQLIRSILVALLAAGFAIPVFAQQTTAPTDVAALVLTHANLIDGISNKPLRDATVVLLDGKITSVSSGSGDLPAGATVLDLKGHWLLPGLIDAHVHLNDLGAARIALASGVTTARCLGVNRFIDVGIRELNHAGVLDLPDIVAFGYQVVAQPWEQFFLDFPHMNDLMRGVRGPENARRMVRAIAARGVNGIKVLASERNGLPQTEPRKRMFTDDELAAIVEEANKLGLPVAAHAHDAEGAAAAVRAGARSIEHGTYLTDQTLALMKQRGTYLVPTLSALAGNSQTNPIVAARYRAIAPRRRELTARALKMGIRIVAGSDVQYDDERRFQDELAALVAVGMRPMDAIKAATSIAAELLLISARTGAVKPGLEADLIAVDIDPLADINALRDVLLVINDGHVAVNRLTF